MATGISHRCTNCGLMCHGNLEKSLKLGAKIDSQIEKSNGYFPLLDKVKEVMQDIIVKLQNGCSIWECLAELSSVQHFIITHMAASVLSSNDLSNVMNEQESNQGSSSPQDGLDLSICKTEVNSPYTPLNGEADVTGEESSAEGNSLSQASHFGISGAYSMSEHEMKPQVGKLEGPVTGSGNSAANSDDQIEVVSHQQLETISALYRDPSVPVTEPRIYRCGKCTLVVHDVKKIISHQIQHGTLKPFSCQHCTSAFGSFSKLERHQRSHDGHKPFICSRCGSKFTRLSSLRMHERIHTGFKPFVCPECGSSFYHHNDLKRHSRIHSNERPFVCPHCDSRFREAGKLRRHLRIHTGEKPYKCTLCPAKFSRLDNLKQHQKVHIVGVQPFVGLEVQPNGASGGEVEKVPTDLSVGATDLSSGAGVSDLSAGIGMSDLSAGIGMSDLSAGGRMSDLSAGVRMSDLSTGGRMSDLSGGVRMSDLSAGGSMSDLSAGGRMSDLSTGVRMSDLSAGGRMSDLSAGIGMSELMGSEWGDSLRVDDSVALNVATGAVVATGIIRPERKGFDWSSVATKTEGPLALTTSAPASEPVAGTGVALVEGSATEMETDGRAETGVEEDRGVFLTGEWEAVPGEKTD